MKGNGKCVYLGSIESFFRFLESELLLLIESDSHFDTRKTKGSWSCCVREFCWAWKTNSNWPSKRASHSLLLLLLLLLFKDWEEDKRIYIEIEHHMSRHCNFEAPLGLKWEFKTPTFLTHWYLWILLSSLFITHLIFVLMLTQISCLKCLRLTFFKLWSNNLILMLQAVVDACFLK